MDRFVFQTTSPTPQLPSLYWVSPTFIRQRKFVIAAFITELAEAQRERMFASESPEVYTRPQNIIGITEEAR